MGIATDTIRNSRRLGKGHLVHLSFFVSSGVYFGLVIRKCVCQNGCSGVCLFTSLY